jgi:hypothetical protein
MSNPFHPVYPCFYLLKIEAEGALNLFGLSKWVEGRIGAGPHAGGLFKQIALHGMRAAVGRNARQLLRQVLGRVNDLRLKSHISARMGTILNFNGLPGLFSHSEPPGSQEGVCVQRAPKHLYIDLLRR